MSYHTEVNGSLLSREKVQKIKVLIVDDQLSSRKFLEVILDSEPDLEVVGTAKDGQEALAQVEMLHPDIVLMDLEMPGMDGITATETICQRFPETQVIVITSHEQQEYINRALRAGAKGFFLKDTPSKKLTNAIRLVNQDYIQFRPGLFKQVDAEVIDIIAKDKQESNGNGDRHEATRLDCANSNNNKLSKRDDWSHGTKELLDILPQVWTRGLLYFLTIFVGIVLPWAMFSLVEETGTARGRLEPQGKTFKLDAPVAGTVAEIQVEEGESVKAGQSLLVLESELIKWELRQAQENLEGQLNRLAQLDLLKNQLVIALATQRQQNQAQELEKQAQIHQTQQELKYSQTAYQLIGIRLANARREVERYQKASEEGIVSAIKVAESEDMEKEKQRLYEQTKSDIQQAKLRLKEQESSYQSLIHSGKLAVLKSLEQLKNLETQITTLKADIAQSKSQIDSLEFQLKQRVLEAPLEGIVFQLPIEGEGEVVQPGDLIAEIAPKGTSLSLRAQMATTDSGSLAKGMPVKMKFDAYPFQDYGVVEGELVEISPTTEEIETPEGKIAAYNLEIKLNRTCIPTPTECIALRPGDTATAEVIVRQRRVIDFILDPFKKLQKVGLEL